MKKALKIGAKIAGIYLIANAGVVLGLIVPLENALYNERYRAACKITDELYDIFGSNKFIATAICELATEWTNAKFKANGSDTGIVFKSRH